MQIWEAETLHMSQLAGGWDFLTLSGRRCASEKKKKLYYKQSCSGGEAACCSRCRSYGLSGLGWKGQTDKRPEGAAETSPGATGSAEVVGEVEVVAEVRATSASTLCSLDSPQQRGCISGLLVLLVLIATELGTGEAAPVFQLAGL